MPIIIPNPPEQEWNTGATSTELRVQRRLTHAFIETQPVDLVLTPRAQVRAASGGWLWVDQAPRPPQRLRLIEPGVGEGLPRPTVNVDGIIRVIEFELVGPHDASFGEHDVFTYGGAEWEVVTLGYPNGWEQRALVARYDV